MSETFVPPEGVATAAKRALGWIADGKAGDGFTSAGRTRAGQLSRRDGLSTDTIMRMVSFFARHEVDKKAEGFNQGEKGFPSAGRVAWDAWGGDAGKSWAESIASKLNKEKAPMANDFANSYAAIIKQEKQDDGSLLVYGKATDDSLDIDQQICDDVWLSSAMPEWFKSGGNIREQHSSIAAGVAKEYESKADGHYISVLVVDPVSVKKVESGVLKGFSIGIKSPRVVRDQKAANGRIIDGQIVEVSLVDRPANPNAKLMLAKSVEGETSLVKVEEYSEKADKPDYANMLPGGEKSEPANADLYAKVKAEAKQKFDVYPSAVANAWVVQEYKKRGGTYKAKSKKSLSKNGNIMLGDVIKELHADSTKFDQASYDAARKGIAQLIISEATEVAETDSDERDDIDTLLSALKHLFSFRDGELEEDEDVNMATNGSTIELSANKEADSEDTTTADCGCDGCAACKADGGCDDKMCKGCTKMDKSATIGKCLQCGCGQVGQDHGLSQVVVTGAAPTHEVANVSTATIMTPEQNAGSIKSAEGEEVVAEDKPAEEVSEETPVEVKEDEILDEKSVTAIIEKAVKSATETVKAEIADLQAATKAAEDRAVALESELVTAKSAALSGGPKRTGRVAVTDTNELLLKAAEYRQKAAATSDSILAKGYKALEKEYMAKATPAKSVTSDEE
jgi:hypothetical protein